MDNLVQYWNLTREQLPYFLSLTGNIAAAFFIFIVGWSIGRWARKRVRNSHLGGEHLDPTLKPVLASIIFYSIVAMTLYAVLIKVGFPPASLLAVFGAAGLAIGLSLKDTLSNIAAGMMLLFLRPMAVGEYVDIGGAAGTVAEIGLFATTLKTPDGIYQYVPNSKVWDGRIQNFGRHSMRRCVIDIGVSYNSDLRHVKTVLLETLHCFPDRILQGDTPLEPEAFVTGFGESAINFQCRVWLPADSWLSRTSELRIRIFEALGKADIEIPFPQRVVTMKKDS